MRYIIEHANSGVAVHDRELRYLYVSQQYLKDYHLQDRDVIGRHHYEVIPSIPQKWRDIHQRVLAGETLASEQDSYLRNDGTIEWTRWSCRPWYASSGEVGGIIVYTEIITERVQAEETLRQSEEYQRAMIAAAPLAIFTISVDGRVRSWNAGAERIFGWRKEEILGDLLPIVPREEMASFDALRARIASGEAVRQVELTRSHKSGMLIPVSLSAGPIRDQEGRVTGIMALIEDITDRRRAEQSLRLFKTIFDTAHFGMDISTLDGTLVYMNDYFAALHGYQAGELVGGSLERLHSDAQLPHVHHMNAEILANGVFGPVEIGHCHRDGTEFPMLMTGVAVPDAQGNPEYFAATAIDIRIQKALEAQLNQAQKMESVGRLAGGVAHDFNNMLNVILGHCDLLMETATPGLPFQENLEEIHNAAKRSADLTRQLLAFARRQTVVPEVLDLNETVESLLKMLMRLIGEDVTLHWNPGTNLEPIYLDPAQIDQMLVNLVVNARDAIVQGSGQITIETGMAEFGTDYGAMEASFIPGSYVMLAVRDDGAGMDAEIRAKIFEPFFTTKAQGEGTGLGLATVYGIVQQNNGFIEVHSAPDQGTAFQIYLPVHKGVRPLAETSAAPKTAQISGQETILLVEDELPNLAVATKILERLGYRVLAAATPAQALRLAQEHAGEIHLLITDVVMPEMNGRDLAVKLLSLYPTMKRLFMSGYTADVIAHQGVLDAGVNFIQKPFSIHALGEKVRDVIDA
jgi:PAS domain S-box-containing protein